MRVLGVLSITRNTQFPPLPQSPSSSSLPACFRCFLRVWAMCDSLASLLVSCLSKVFFLKIAISAHSFSSFYCAHLKTRKRPNCKTCQDMFLAMHSGCFCIKHGCSVAFKLPDDSLIRTVSVRSGYYQTVTKLYTSEFCIS